MMRRTISMTTVLSVLTYGLLAEEIVWVGGSGTNWSAAANWSPAQVPGANDDATIASPGAKVFAPEGFSVHSLTLSSGSELSLGHQAERTPWQADVAEDLKVSGSARLYAYAAALPDVSVFTNRTQATAAIYTHATKVNVGGEFSVSGGATVYPDNDRITGAPVIFKSRDFVLAADGMFDTRLHGWAWSLVMPAGGAPAGSTGTGPASVNPKTGYTFGFGVGASYSTGAGYGGFGGGYTATHGLTNGTPFAPFLPGSPSGWENSGNGKNIIAPGSIVVFASGTATLAGTMNADGKQCEYSACSGGGIWVAAKTLSVSPTTRLTATTTKMGGGAYRGGGGGRIALASGVTQSEIDTLAAASTLPAGYVSHDLVECAVDVTGAGSGVGEPLKGTATFVTFTGVGLSLAHRSDTPVVAEALPFVAVALSNGTPHSVTAPEYGHAASDPENIRFACTGFVLSNATAEVATSDGRTCTFTPYATDGPYSITWKWADCERRVRVSASGEGTVTVNNGAADRWFAAGTEVTLAATPAEGSAFIGWFGDIPGSQTTDTTVTFTPVAGVLATAAFANADGTTSAKTWTGAAGTGDWDDAGNWNPTGVPTATDAVSITLSTSIYAPRMVIAGSLTLGANATLHVASTGTSVTAAPQDAGAATPTRVFHVIGDVASAGKLVLGGIGGLVEQYVFNVGGDVTLSGTSRTAVYAARGIGDVSTLPQLFAKRTTFRIGGDLSLLDTASLYPVADPLTGTAVFFDVADAVAIASGAAVDAKGRGYDWVLCEDGVADGRMIATINKRNISTILLELYQTFAGGPGRDYTVGAGHGGPSLKATGIYGQAYGSRHAPLTCGSPSGLLNQNPTIVGGGVVWIRAAGAMTVNGKLTAETSGTGNSGASGGSIWLLAPSFTFGETAQVLAQGGDGGYGDGGSSGGGRVSLASGMTDALLAELVSLETLTDNHLDTAITECSPNVAGGVGAGKYHGYAGTATRIYAIGDGTTLELATDTPVAAEGLVWTTRVVADGESVAVTAPAYGYLASNPENVRYACAGYVLSNALGQVSAGLDPTCSFTVDSDDGPYILTWRWNRRENRFRADASDDNGGTIKVNDSGATDCWFAEGTDVTLSARPKAGKKFVCWLGDVPGGKTAAATLTFTPAVGAKATAVFANADGTTTAKTWTGGAGTTAWDDAGNWNPAGVPTASDDVSITVSASVYAPRGIIAASLTLGAQARLFIATKSASLTDAPQDNGETAPTRFFYVVDDLNTSGKLYLGGSGDAVPTFVLHVGGNAAFSGAAETSVYAVRTTGPADAASLYAARTDFYIGGTLLVADTAVIYAVCDPLTGTAVRFAPRALSVAPGASIRSDGRGYRWQRCPDGTIASKDPRAVKTASAVTLASNLNECYQTFGPGAGLSYTHGAGHGGLGGYNISRSSDFGCTYDRPYAPVMPGSPNGFYNAVLDNAGRGGGVVWIDVSERAEIHGTLAANNGAAANGAYAAPSGGSIWMTAGRLGIGSTAVFSAKGGTSGYDSQGGGGRIALATGLSAARVATLGETGELPGLSARRFLDQAAFEEKWPGATVTVARGGGIRAEDGTFCFIDGVEPGLVIVIK